MPTSAKGPSYFWDRVPGTGTMSLSPHDEFQGLPGAPRDRLQNRQETLVEESEKSLQEVIADIRLEVLTFLFGSSSRVVRF